MSQFYYETDEDLNAIAGQVTAVMDCGKLSPHVQQAA